MDAVEALVTRQSPTKLTEPAPPADILARALEAGARAPDHGKLRPWRFILISGDARHQFGDLLARALKAREPGCADALIEKERAKPLRAPLIIVVAAALQPDHPKIPELEQLLAAGCAAQNIQVALHAGGYGCVWKTGAPAYDPAIAAGLGLGPQDRIIGFLYAGTVEVPAAPLKRPDLSAVVRDWTHPVTTAP